jgi:hypothetical protein
MSEDYIEIQNNVSFLNNVSFEKSPYYFMKIIFALFIIINILFLLLGAFKKTIFKIT